MAKNLESVYELLLEDMGPQGWWPARTDFEVIVGAILAQNTNWKNVAVVIKELERRGLLEADKLDKIRTEDLARLIRPTGYFNQKARKLKAFLEYFKKYDFDLKAMLRADKEVLRKELLSVWGIGPETADAILLYALRKPVFVVDAYTRRTFFRMGFVGEEIGYEELRAFFEDRLDPNIAMFKEFHALIDELAKRHCNKKPICEKCPVADLCDFVKKNKR